MALQGLFASMCGVNGETCSSMGCYNNPHNNIYLVVQFATFELYNLHKKKPIFSDFRPVPSPKRALLYRASSQVHKSAPVVSLLIFQIMQAGDERESMGLQEIIFEVVKKVQFGRAVFVAGSAPELGAWDPHKALRLEWNEGEKWRGRAKVARAHRVLQFKFLEGAWEDGGQETEWEVGRCNRRVRLEGPSPQEYFAQWNMQHYIFLLRTQDFEERESYFMTGAVSALGGWRARRPMRRLVQAKNSPFVQLCRNNPEFAEEASFSRIFMLDFWVGREVEGFVYQYEALGNSQVSESRPERNCRLLGSAGGGGEPDRVGEFDWEGSRVVIDDCALDKMILQRFSNTIYLASRLQPAHFSRLLQVQPSALILLVTSNQHYSSDAPTLSAMAIDHHLVTRTILLESQPSALAANLQDAVEEVQRLLEYGHRVVLNVSSRAMRLFPLHMLYLVLFAGYSFGEAMESLGQKDHPSEEECKITRQLYKLISGKLMRGRVEVKL